jgi:UPF0755 protein
MKIPVRFPAITGFRRYWKRSVILVAVLAVLFAVGRFAYFLTTPTGAGGNVKLVDFSRGSSLRKLADELETGGVIGNSGLFVLYARLKGVAGKVQAGAYQFNDSMKPADILRMLVAGEVYEKRFAVPEGYSIYQLAEMLDERGIFRKEAFLAECRNKTVLNDMGIRGKSVEGYLYPSTYNLVRIENPAALVKTMTGQFSKIYEERFASLEKGSGLTRHQIITLASMVEKEAVLPSEKPLIASVFHNRLKKGIPLQSDPTAVYGVRAFGGKVSKTDVHRNSPYNTYIIRGLPPGPIGNPGSGAIEAVLKPAASGFYYFVARNDGSHQFSVTLDEHNRAVNRYLKGNPVQK